MEFLEQLDSEVDVEKRTQISYEVNEELQWPNFFDQLEINKKLKQNELDEYQLQRPSLQETNLERKQRIQKKIKEKKEKQKRQERVEQQEQNSQLNDNQFSKEELRKIKNRNSAQQSRDKKKLLFAKIQEENSFLYKQLELKNQEIEGLIIENQKIQLELSYYREQNGQGPICSKCQNEISSDLKQELDVARPQVVTNKMISKYGLICLISMLSIVAILAQNPSKLSQPVSLQQKSLLNSTDLFLKNEQEIKNSTKIEITSSLSSQKNLYSLGNIHQSKYQLASSISYDQTQKIIFVNCTIGKDECDNFLKFYKLRNGGSQIYQMNLEEKLNPRPIRFLQQQITPNNSSFEENYQIGSQLVIVKVQQAQLNDTSYQINQVRCIVEEQNIIQIDAQLIEGFNIL